MNIERIKNKYQILIISGVTSLTCAVSGWVHYTTTVGYSRTSAWQQGEAVKTQMEVQAEVAQKQAELARETAKALQKARVMSTPNVTGGNLIYAQDGVTVIACSLNGQVYPAGQDQNCSTPE